jgi:hypothetical protein
MVPTRIAPKPKANMITIKMTTGRYSSGKNALGIKTPYFIPKVITGVK